jgi:hypothetical protein
MSPLSSRLNKPIKTHSTSLLHVSSLPNTPLRSFLDQQNPSVSGPQKFVFLSPIGSLGGHVRAQRFSFCPTASQWELKSALPFPSGFLYNPKFPASQLFGLLSVFTLVSCPAYSTLKMEAIYSSETSVYCQRTTRRNIPEDSKYCVWTCLSGCRRV